METVRSRGLKEETKELHHSAEKHPIGSSMADGTMRKEWWIEWISALLIIHNHIDAHNDESMARSYELMLDLSELGEIRKPNKAATEYVKTLTTREEIDAATYVFTGAHLMGGAITAKMLSGKLPINHLVWNDRKETMSHWSPLRERTELKDGANRAFKAVIDILDEILENHPC